MKVIVAGCFSPAIRALESLFQEGIGPKEIRLLTNDLRGNKFLIEYAKKYQIEFSTLAVKSNECHQWIKQFSPDVIFSIYFRDIFPGRVIQEPRMGCINLHPSLLPNYRGTFSAPWVILNSEKVTGISYHYIVEEVDAGKIILQHKVNVKKSDTAFSLYHRLIHVGLCQFPKAFDLVVRKKNPGTMQIGEPSYYPRKVPFAGIINPEWDIKKIDRFIRAMYFPPYRGAVVKLKNGEEREILSIADYQKLQKTGLVS